MFRGIAKCFWADVGNSLFSIVSVPPSLFGYSDNLSRMNIHSGSEYPMFASEQLLHKWSTGLANRMTLKSVTEEARRLLHGCGPAYDFILVPQHVSVVAY